MRKIALGLLLLSVTSAAAIAEEKVSDSAKADFASYCPSFHGVDGKGNGPIAPTLKIAPSDLTVIAKKNNGHFPYTMIRKTIESTELGLARAHGPREMPVWGPVFPKSRRARCLDPFREEAGFMVSAPFSAFISLLGPGFSISSTTSSRFSRSSCS